MAVIQSVYSIYNVDRKKKKLEKKGQWPTSFLIRHVENALTYFLQRTRNLSVFDLISGMTNKNTYFRFMAYIS